MWLYEIEMRDSNLKSTCEGFHPTWGLLKVCWKRKLIYKPPSFEFYASMGGVNAPLQLSGNDESRHHDHTGHHDRDHTGHHDRTGRHDHTGRLCRAAAWMGRLSKGATNVGHRRPVTGQYPGNLFG